MFGLREIVYLNKVAARLGDRAALAEIRGGGGRALFDNGRPRVHAGDGAGSGPPLLLEEDNDEGNPDGHE